MLSGNNTGGDYALPRYSEELIADIFAANDIIDYVSRYVTLKKHGRDYMGLCPFHNEKSPSFHVSADKQLFHCFGCGAGGNLVQFVMRSENLDFTDALKLLADNAGIVIPEDNNSYDDELHRKRQKIYEMNKLAARHFYGNLTDENIGAAARDYISDRRLSVKTVKTYGLGYAKKSYDDLLNVLKNAGYTEQDAVEASLAAERDGKIYDKFRDRLMFPIIDVRGNIIGFGGRIISEDKNAEFKPPKYLNSGETAAFDKGKNLFSLNLAKKADTKQLILCEGYMDVISVYQAGIENVVATLGTALTENQAKIMCRYASEVLICYDMDEAGRKAVMRAIDIFSSVGGRTRVVKMKGAKDPDEFIKANGAALFKKSLSEAIPSTEFKLATARVNYNINETDGKIRYVSEAAGILSGVNDPIEVDAYINNLSETTGIGKEAIYAEYRKYASPKKEQRSGVKRSISPKNSATLIKTEDNKTEIELLNLISRDNHVYRAVSEYIKPEDYSDDTLRTLADYIYKCRQNGTEPDAAGIMNEFSDNEIQMSIASAVFYVLAECADKKNAVRQMVVKVLLDKNKRQIGECAGDSKRLGELLTEQRKIQEIKLSWE